MSIPYTPISPLRQRFIDDMSMRRLAPKTQSSYIRAVKRFAQFLGRSPHTATPEDLRRFQLQMVNDGISAITLNATLTALRFLFQVTLDRAEVLRLVSTVRVPRKLPVVLSQEEVTHLLNAASSPRNKTALAVAYAAGLRVSEVASLRVNDIDSERMAIRIDQGKGSKDRFAMLSPTLLELLRDWWRIAHAQHLMLCDGWLFPGLNPVNHITTRQLSRVCHDAAAAAKIDKRVSMHTLRHSFATHLLEQHVDIRIIQVLLGHNQLGTTAHYSQVATRTLREVKGPLEHLTLRPAS
ncbi:site-specific integrase [uncultured Neptuniibacter sp.]|uniref:tyrosine-type recombinase/integrase n=1 Tax=uncultured Neptuniibacter sp. TaxID=502143 RepID=UPI00314F8833|tara:strand:- start:830 stop:1714 length:885 start_codon:yes stop_codon:yes gene_type:complete